jgi:hypothetical protein
MFLLACKQRDLSCVECHSDTTAYPTMQENFIHYFVRGYGGDECLLCSRKYSRLSYATGS